MKTITRAAGTVVALALVALGATGCEPPLPAELTVTYAPGRGGDEITYTVRCGPKTAEITPAVRGLDPAQACRVATAQAPLLVDGPPARGACTQMIHGWERATVSGQIDGAPVDLLLHRANGCANADWLRLVGLVPAPARPPSTF